MPRVRAAGLGMLLAFAMACPAAAITAEEATRVGGDLTKVGGAVLAVNDRLATFRASAVKMLEAAPHVGEEIARAEANIRHGRGTQEMLGNATVGLVFVLVLTAARQLFRRVTRRWRQSLVAGEMRSRGAAGLAALEAAEWAVFAIGAYAVIKFYFDGEDPQALMMIGILAGLIRWLLFMVFLETLLRPTLSAFRLIAMSDRAARQVKACFAAATFVGILGISVMPVWLRVGLPIPSGQVLVFAQGAVVAVGCTAGWLCYLASPATPARRMWQWLGGISIPVIWLTWNVAVVSLEFAAYHSLVYSLRIALIAYAVHALLGLSARTHWGLRLVQHATNAGAFLALSITLTELWLVDQLALVPLAQWLPVRHALVTTAITLFAGFVAWRYLDLWTEQRLRAANPGLAPGIDDDVAAEPASRLTTLLPMVRVTVGVVILVFVAFLAMSQLGADLTTLLAGAGVFGLAISFGSQALVRDIVAGIFFMSDDAFRVGEYIDTGRLKGTVERVTLRSVRLRHQNGQVHTIPFGQLSAITNFSRDWQTVKFNLRLLRSTDIEQTRKTAKRVGQEMLLDPEFGHEFLLPLKLQGMVEITDSALVVRLKFTVKPSNPSVIQREALKRLHRAFAQDGIGFADGVITVQPAGSPALPPALGAAAASAAVPAAAMASVAS